MPKRKLALVLVMSMSAIVIVQIIAFTIVGHGSAALLSAGITATIPGFVIAALAWRGKLPFACAPRKKTTI